MTEKQLLDGLLDWARQLGFITVHIPDRLYALAAEQGRYDAMSGAKSWPDITAVGHGHMLLLECKTETGRVKPGQLEMLDALAAVSNDRVHVRVVRPADYDEVIALMQRCREEGWQAA